jgi:hypothetical protein
MSVFRLSILYLILRNICALSEETKDIRRQTSKAERKAIMMREILKHRKIALSEI